jgi:hypothetical protein
MYENVVQHVEMGKYKVQKIVRIVVKMCECVEVRHVEME